MLKNLGVRWFLIGVVLLFAAYQIWPTYEYYTMSDDEISQMELDNPKKLKSLHKNSINLGLDLQGGMHVILEVDIPVLMEKLADPAGSELLEAIKKSEEATIENSTEFFDEFKNYTEGISLIRYYSSLDDLTGKDNASVITELKNQGENAIQSALEIIRNRVDEFGVSEPNIQKSGKRRIIVELAGVKNPERARILIQRTALLEFALVRDNTELQTIFENIDNSLIASNIIEEPEIVTEENIVTEDTEIDTTETELDKLISGSDSEEEINLISTPEELLKEKPFSGYLKAFPNGIGVLSGDYNKFKKLLEKDNVQNLIPKDAVFRWSNRIMSATTEDGSLVEYRNLYYLNANPILTGGVVTEARATVGGVGSDQTGQPVVNFTMDASGAKTWSRFTGANINRKVAIILDKKVYMAPVIRDRIPGGRTQISGLDNIEEAKDIANVLRAGKLPAPVNVIEERTVGPSLGQDSINSGARAMFYGFLFVIVFIVLYYNASGLLANTALILNLFIVISVLGLLEATLTLPGIAGLILTIGMAVDANVIVFERIREELTKGKTVRASIDSGYERAFVTILDANVTTLIAAFVLAWIGSGPIKGFAITLSVGIICSMFTAIFVTRTILMLFCSKKPLTKLSI